MGWGVKGGVWGDALIFKALIQARLAPSRLLKKICEEKDGFREKGERTFLLLLIFMSRGERGDQKNRTRKREGDRGKDTDSNEPPGRPHRGFS